MSALNLFAATSASSATPTPTASAVVDISSPGEIIDRLDQWQQEVFQFGIIGTVIFAAIVAAITFIIIKILQRYVKKRLSGNMKIFYRLIYVIIIVIAVMTVLMTIKPLEHFSSAILASSGIAAVVIGLAAQQTLGNLFSGISISASKPFVVGEFIEVLNTTPPIAGVVEDISLRHTTIRESSNKTIVIPNSVIDKEMLRTTHYLQGTNVCNFLFVGISYDSDIDLAIKLLSRVCSEHQNTLDVRTYDEKENDAPIVAVHIMDLAESSIQLRASIWTKNTAKGFAALSDLRYAVKKEFDKNGIDIPYPYRNIVIKDKGDHKHD